MQEDLRICFETPGDGKESHVDRASGKPILHRTIYMVRRTIASLGDEVKTFSESDPDAPRHPSASSPGGAGNVRSGQTEKSRQRHDTAGLPSTADMFDECRHGR